MYGLVAEAGKQISRDSIEFLANWKSKVSLLINCTRSLFALCKTKTGECLSSQKFLY